MSERTPQPDRFAWITDDTWMLDHEDIVAMCPDGSYPDDPETVRRVWDRAALEPGEDDGDGK